PIAEIRPALDRVEAAVDVVADEVVEKDVARLEAVRRGQRMIDLADGELRVADGGHVCRLVQSQLRRRRRRDGDDATAREIAPEILVAGKIVRPVPDDGAAAVEGVDVDV